VTKKRKGKNEIARDNAGADHARIGVSGGIGGPTTVT